MLKILSVQFPNWNTIRSQRHAPAGPAVNSAIVTFKRGNVKYYFLFCAASWHGVFSRSAVPFSPPSDTRCHPRREHETGADYPASAPVFSVLSQSQVNSASRERIAPVQTSISDACSIVPPQAGLICKQAQLPSCGWYRCSRRSRTHTCCRSRRSLPRIPSGRRPGPC